MGYLDSYNNATTVTEQRNVIHWIDASIRLAVHEVQSFCPQYALTSLEMTLCALSVGKEDGKGVVFCCQHYFNQRGESDRPDTAKKYTGHTFPRSNIPMLGHMHCGCKIKVSALKFLFGRHIRCSHRTLCCAVFVFSCHTRKSSILTCVASSSLAFFITLAWLSMISLGGSIHAVPGNGMHVSRPPLQLKKLRTFSLFMEFRMSWDAFQTVIGSLSPNNPMPCLNSSNTLVSHSSRCSAIICLLTELLPGMDVWRRWLYRPK